MIKATIEKKLSHYVGKAIADYNMIQKEDRVMVCLSGGKDSWTLLHLLHRLQKRTNNKFTVFAFTLNQCQPGWNDDALKQWLIEHQIPFEILKQDTFSVVKEKIPADKTYCGLCSRLRRGAIYSYAKKNGFTKVALGHHRDDLIQSLLMSILYNGQIKSMPPKLLTDDEKHLVIRPLCYCQEKDIIQFSKIMEFPTVSCGACGTQENLMRVRVAKLIEELTKENPKIPSNMLHALQSVCPSQLMDQKLWDFKRLKIVV